MTPAKKMPKKTAAALAAVKAPAKAPAALLPMPGEWDGPSAWKGRSAGWRLVNANLVDEEKLFDVTQEDGVDDEVADWWLTHRLTEAERAQVAELVRVVSWLDHVQDAGATAAQLTLPDCLLPIVATALNTTAALRGEFEHAIIGTGETDVPDRETTAAAEDTIRPTDETTTSIGEPPIADADGQLSLVQETAPPKKPLTPLTFQSGEQVASVRLALKARADDLRGEAKRLSGLGRTVEAAALEREARDISEQLLRQVESQAAIPFNDSETLPQAIKRVVQGEVRYRARAALLKNVAVKKGETKQDAEQRALAKLDDLEQLIGNIGEQAGLLVCDILVEAADRAKDAGRVERQATASQLAREAVQAVEGRKLAERDAA